MSDFNDWLIWVQEQLPEYGIEISEEVAMEIAKDLVFNAQHLNSMSFEMRGGKSSTPSVDYERLYRKEKDRADALEKENHVFLNSVCQRRKVSPDQVRIENDTVMIYM